MKKMLNYFFIVIFSAAFPLGCISSSYVHLKGLFGFHGIKFTILRYVIIFCVLFILTVLMKKNNVYLTYYVPCITLLITLIGALDHFVFERILYNYSYFLWFASSVCVANAAVFLGATFSFKKNYDKFYYYFWSSFSMLYILILRVAFIRDFGSLKSINLKPFAGTMKFIKLFLTNQVTDAYIILVLLGNMFILLPLPFIMLAIFRKPNHLLMIPTGLIIPFIIESAEYLFSNGNADIDDIILNSFGFIIGYIIMNLIYKYKLTPPGNGGVNLLKSAN
ncbi:MAG: VanZ family protein [Eubacterium sp.]|nr:VanZ family protein [Eubacterium sp.]